MRIKFLIIFFLINITHLFSQTVTISGTVKNSLSEPIPYVHIIIKKAEKGSITNEDGIFSLNFSDVEQNDSVSFSIIGYEKYICTIYELQQKQNIILKEREYEINTITVIPKQEELIEFGKFSEYQEDSISYFSLQWNWKWGLAFSKYFPNPNKETGMIKSVNFFIPNIGKPKTPFRIIIMGINSNTLLPDKHLLNQDFIVKGEKGKWIEIDVSENLISIPEDGFFVGLEWLHTGKKKYKWKTKEKFYIYKNGKKSKRRKKISCYGQTIQTGIDSKQYHYYKVKGWGWKEIWKKQKGGTLFIKSKVLLNNI